MSQARKVDAKKANDISDGYSLHFRLESELAKRFMKFHEKYTEELDRLGVTGSYTATIRRLLCLALDAQDL